MLSCVGITPDGVALPLPAPLSLRLQREEEAPADALDVLFPAEGEWETLAGFRCYDEKNRMAFDGIVDEQIWKYAGTGATRQVIARSRAALLLDNEAQPQTYYMPSLKLLFERHAAPYGFSGYMGRDEVFGGAYTVEKGVSEWQALRGFCREFLHVEPVPRGDRLDASGEGQAGSVRFSNRGGVLFTELALRWNDYERISEARLRAGEAGDYNMVLRDGEAVARGVRRRRFLSTADAEQARRLLDRARRKAFAVRVVCPGLVEVPLGTEASVELDHDRRAGLQVAAWMYRLTASGETTSMTLRERGTSDVVI